MVGIISRGSELDPYSLKLFTLGNRTFVENEMPEEDRNPVALREARDIWVSIFPDLKPRSLTAMYNCAGMVFASRRTCVKNMKDIDIILVDDGYRRVNDERDVDIGDVVVYRNTKLVPRHVGLVCEKTLILDLARPPFDIWVMSQWGDDGEYRHRLKDVPELFGDQIEFWSDRK